MNLKPYPKYKDSGIEWIGEMPEGWEVKCMDLKIADENRLKKIVKEAVKDALEDEIMKMRLLFAPYVSDEEQKEIERSYGKPLKEPARTLILEE
ncbi:MAG: hypothetical protein IBX72_13530 [Nitrospirae bacterium]|nr:hypothetical protein [Nitrospirota bacterium]